ncbi:unnamed protein product [Mycena citricolor]|uniref:VIT-domain-containing protein n=1 Tax=Mycena citricolor TaxID=2018698 RepID=A0AAD2JXH6_9AGAR|nr:unnamed protein product [Mycena citricolor]
MKRQKSHAPTTHPQTHSMTAIYGLFYYHEYQAISAPLLAVHASAQIKELAAQVTLTQTYANDAGVPIEARYVFPVPNRAVVSSFTMVREDGSKIVGNVKEKQEARAVYEDALASGRHAGLLEQLGPDTFHVSVGNIQPDEQVQIELVYATELTEDEDSDSIRFHLPVHIGSRYGAAPQPTAPKYQLQNVWIKSSPDPFLTITTDVESASPISKIGSPSHTISTELGPDPLLPNHQELPFSNFARVSLFSDTVLDRDFVLTVKSAGLDTPRCIAEMHPVHNTVALGLTLVPRFTLPDLSRQEFVFLVDRSGSMRGQRMKAATKALVVMLRALPHQDCLFQIASFGSRTSLLWPSGSRAYNQATLEEATQHVDRMAADYGGTEIRNALATCFAQRRKDRPMSVLVLTDGDAWDLDGVLNEIKATVDSPQDKHAPVRVSVLGIGNSASTAMCEGIARVGNGTCMMVGEDEGSFMGKVARMLKAARTPPISDIRIDWGRRVREQTPVHVEDDDFEVVESAAPEEKKTLNIFDESAEHSLASGAPPPPPAVVLAPFSEIQQAPFEIKSLYPHIRLNAYAILQGKEIPKVVTLRGTTFDGAEIELPVTVSVSHLQNSPGAPPAIHSLAARKLIQDLEDGRHALGTGIADFDLLARTVKASVVRLGTTYSIASTHTSFVAVEESDRTAARDTGHAFHAVPSAMQPQRVRGSSRIMLSLGGARSSYSRDRGRSAPNAGNYSSQICSLSGSPPSQGAYPVPQLPVASAYSPMSYPMAPAAASSISAAVPQSQFFSGILETGSFSAAPGPTQRRRLSRRDMGQKTAMPQSTELYGSMSVPAMSNGASSAGAMAGPAVADLEPMDALEALARLQAFDGGFTLQVLDVIQLKPGITADTIRNELSLIDSVLATLLAMAYLATKLVGVDRNAWEGIYDKAKLFVGQSAALENQISLCLL